MTAVALLIGWLSLRQTKSELALSRHEVEGAHRPVVMPVVYPPNRNMPRVNNQGCLELPVQNIGTGPALRVEESVYLLSGTDWIMGGEAALHPSGSVGGIAVGQMAWCLGQVRPSGGLRDFWLYLTCDDVSGKGWLTVAQSNAQQLRFTDIGINPVADGPYQMRGEADRVKAVPAEPAEGWWAILSGT